MSSERATVPMRVRAVGSAQRSNGSSTDPFVDPSSAAVPRLAILAWLFACMAVIAATITTLVHVGVIEMPVPQSSALSYSVLAIGIIAAIAMIAVTNTPLPADKILAVGLVFQVVGGLVISLAEQEVAKHGMPVVAVWILTFTILPVSPQRAALGAYATALTIPTGIVIHILAGNRQWPLPSVEWLSIVGGLVAATISTIISRVMYGLGRQVERARRLGAYELVEQLGHGGMGEVWRAEHHSLIRPAAIKLLRRELTERLPANERESLNARFQREVQSTAMLTSPHTVAVFDFGHTHDGALYYVMELLHGLDVETLIEKHGPQPAERVIYLLRQVCDSLAEAHRRNLIHRDIKPANIYLCAIGLKVDFVKVLDFGLVHDVTSNLRLTSEGAVSGTPAYVAPEAAAKNQFDARGDIYALGCVAYYMLTGQLVFDAETSAGMLAAHIRDQPVPPSQRSELPIPPALDAVVLACLAKDPKDRPQSAEELQQRLNEVPLATPWNQCQAKGWWSVHVPSLVERACTECGTSTRMPPLRNRPTPVVRDTVGI